MVPLNYFVRSSYRSNPPVLFAAADESPFQATRVMYFDTREVIEKG